MAYFPPNQREMTIPTGAFIPRGRTRGCSCGLLLHASQASLCTSGAERGGWCGGGCRPRARAGLGVTLFPSEGRRGPKDCWALSSPTSCPPGMSGCLQVPTPELLGDHHRGCSWRCRILPTDHGWNPPRSWRALLFEARQDPELLTATTVTIPR